MQYKALLNVLIPYLDTLLFDADCVMTTKGKHTDPCATLFEPVFCLKHYLVHALGDGY